MKMKYMMTVGLALSLNAFAAEPIQPLKPVKIENPVKVKLGDMLYHDKKLSPDHSVSCASCHDLKKGGTDQLPVSIGIRNQKGPINSPTVFNSRYNIKQFWDGRAKDLKEQAAGPVTNPKEMGSNWPYVIKTLKSEPNYVALFNKVYDGKIDKDSITDAIAQFEMTLITPSRFDDYLLGDVNAITAQEKQGYQTFKAVGCTACHNGINIGGGMFMKLGLVGDYFKERGSPITEADLGRYNVTKSAADKHVFKVPTLRNVELTPPYFHDGNVKTLDEAVIKMAKLQLGRNLSKTEVSDIVAFLKSLTGKNLTK